MKIDRKQHKEIALCILSMIVEDYDKLPREKQRLLYNDMRIGVRKFILKEYHRHAAIEKNK